jgi:hypothetical protein
MDQTLQESSALRRGHQGPAVAALQEALQRLQVLQAHECTAAGVFDAGTELAVRRLQWFAGRVPAARDARGACVPRPLQRLAVNGMVGPGTRQLIQHFITQDWAATGLLVRLDFRQLRRTHPNAGFIALLDGDVRAGLCEREFAGVMVAMDAQAEQLGLHLFVNQLFRVEGDPASPGIGEPASFSPHRNGRAVDLQLGDSAALVTGSNPAPALQLMNAAPGTALARFRQHAQRALKCRYGGDFDPVDPPHFDRQILPAGSQRWKMHYYFNQLQYRQALRNPQAIPQGLPGD